MRRTNRSSLTVEQLDSRITPSWSRAIGTFQIKDITVPTEWVSSPAGSVFGNVIGTDTLMASLDVTYTVDGRDLAKAMAGGRTITGQEVRWREEDSPGPDEDISTVSFNATITAPAGTVGSFSQTVVIRFPVSVTNNAWKDWWDDAEYYGWLDALGPDNYQTHNIVLESKASTAANTGGTAGNAVLRPTSPSVTITQLAALPSPDLPVLAAGGYYKLLSFDSPNGIDFTFTAGNSTGYGLFASSSSALVENADGDRVLDPAAALSAVYPDATAHAGAYDESNKDLVVRGSTTADVGILSGYSYSNTPAALFSIQDGQSVTIPGDAIGTGNDMLWLFFEAGGGTQGFILLPVAPPDPRLTISDVTVTEGDSGTTDAAFTVTLSEPAASDVTVSYSTAPGTGSSPSDFTAVSGTLTFLAGETSKTVTVPVNGGTMYEPDEDFFLTLGSATNAVIADGVGQGTILNDDAQPTISIGDVSQIEGNSGTTQFVFTVTLSNPSWQTISVDFATADGSATGGQDYAATSGTLTFQPGETSKTITVIVYGDTVQEGGGFGRAGDAAEPGPVGEDFFVNLSNSTNASLLDAQGLGFIQDDD